MGHLVLRVGLDGLLEGGNGVLGVVQAGIA